MSTTYRPGWYRGQHILRVNPNVVIDASDEHNCVDVFLNAVTRVEQRMGSICITTIDAEGKTTKVYIHHNIVPKEGNPS